jgi:hypothetical protein
MERAIMMGSARFSGKMGGVNEKSIIFAVCKVNHIYIIWILKLKKYWTMTPTVC